MTDQPIAPGQILAGKYAIDRVLGQGTMGLVLSARHIALQQPVAIKIMLAGRRVTADHEARFLREARIAAMLKSEHAAKVLDMGTHESGAPYIVMEFLDGQDLGAVLDERGPLPVAEAVSYILQACEAIAEAHALGIVHRDIKPANLFLTKGMDGACVKVVDFGVAKQMNSELGLTGTGAALGSPLYMAPEQMNGAPDVDARADIWALAVTLYELLADTTPFHADTMLALMTRMLLSPPMPLEQYRPDVPPGLAAVILQAFEKDRQRRFPSVAEFAAALAPYAGASSAQHVERAAKMQNVEVAASRPTIELRAPSDADLVEAASPNPAMFANGSPGDAPVIVSARRSPAWIAGAAAGALLVLTMPIAVYFGLQARSVAPIDRSTTPATSDATATLPMSAATMGITTAEPSETASPEVPSAVPSASSAPTTRVRSSLGAPPRPPATARPRSGVVGGERR